jgi:hypothetical protein
MLSIVVPSAVILSVVMLSAIVLSAVVLTVVMLRDVVLNGTINHCAGVLTFRCWRAEWCYAEWHYTYCCFEGATTLSKKGLYVTLPISDIQHNNALRIIVIFMLNVIMLSVVMLDIMMLSVVTLIVVAPL